MKNTEHHKQTPQKLSSNSHKKKMIDQALAKDILQPYKETLAVNLLASFTPMRKQPQYLLSPSPVKRDLFSQLLGTQIKHQIVLEDIDFIIEEDLSSEQNDISDDSSLRNQSMEEQGLSQQGQGIWSDDNDIKKRKRKSTAQIKLLKQQLDGEMNWTKQKIVKMSEVTGLSQSQVYKWCWDQKKKQNKNCENSHNIYGDRRRIIRKDISYRNYLPSSRTREQDIGYDKLKDIKSQGNIRENASQTKQKASLGMDEEVQQTEKKVNKRLIFS